MWKVCTLTSITESNDRHQIALLVVHRAHWFFAISISITNHENADQLFFIVIVAFDPNWCNIVQANEIYESVGADSLSYGFVFTSNLFFALGNINQIDAMLLLSLFIYFFVFVRQKKLLWMNSLYWNVSAKRMNDV